MEYLPYDISTLFREALFYRRVKIFLLVFPFFKYRLKCPNKNISKKREHRVFTVIEGIVKEKKKRGEKWQSSWRRSRSLSSRKLLAFSTRMAMVNSSFSSCLFHFRLFFCDLTVLWWCFVLVYNFFEKEMLFMPLHLILWFWSRSKLWLCFLFGWLTFYAI